MCLAIGFLVGVFLHQDRLAIYVVVAGLPLLAAKAQDKNVYDPAESRNRLEQEKTLLLFLICAVPPLRIFTNPNNASFF